MIVVKLEVGHINLNELDVGLVYEQIREVDVDKIVILTAYLMRT